MDLHRARQHWKERRQLEAEWLQQLTVFESVAELQRLAWMPMTRYSCLNESPT